MDYYQMMQNEEMDMMAIRHNKTRRRRTPEFYIDVMPDSEFKRNFRYLPIIKTLITDFCNNEFLMFTCHEIFKSTKEALQSKQIGNISHY